MAPTTFFYLLFLRAAHREWDNQFTLTQFIEALGQINLFINIKITKWVYTISLFCLLFMLLKRQSNDRRIL